VKQKRSSFHLGIRYPVPPLEIGEHGFRRPPLATVQGVERRLNKVPQDLDFFAIGSKGLGNHIVSGRCVPVGDLCVDERLKVFGK